MHELGLIQKGIFGLDGVVLLFQDQDTCDRWSVLYLLLETLLGISLRTKSALEKQMRGAVIRIGMGL